MWLIARIESPARALTPEVNHFFENPLYWFNIFIAGTKIPAVGVTSIAFTKRLRQYQITAQGFKHVLPRAGCFRVSNNNGLLFFECSENIGNQSICSPVTAANDVSCSPGTEQCRSIIVKKRFSISG